jgi:hypothetical protein
MGAVKIQIGADVRELQKGLQQATGALKNAATQWTSALGPMGSAVARAFTNPVAGALAGIAALGAGMYKATKYTEQYYDKQNDLSKILGMSRQDMAALELASTRAHIPFEEVQKVMARLSTEASSGGKELERMGVHVRDAGGNVKPLGEIFGEVIDRLNEMDPTSDRAVAASKVIGKSWIDNRNILDISGASIRKARDDVDELGLANETAAAAQERFEKAQIRLNEQIQALQVNIGGVLMPILADLAESLASLSEGHMPQVSRAMGELISGIKIFGGVISMASAPVRLLGDLLSGVSGAGIGLAMVLSGDVREGVGFMEAAIDELGGSVGKLGERMRDGAKDAKAAWDELMAGGWKAEMELVPLVPDKPKAMRKLGMSDQEIAELKKRRDARRKAAEELAKIEQELREHALDGARADDARELDAKQATYDRLAELDRHYRALTGASAEVALAHELALEQQRFDLAAQAIAQKQAADADDYVKTQEHLAEMYRLQQDHAAKVTALHVDAARAALDAYRDQLTMVGGYAQQMFDGLVRGSGDFAQRVTSTLKQMSLTIASQVFAKLVSTAIASMVAEVAAAKVSALAQIQASAAVAGAGAAASQAAIPIIGPGLALGAMSATSAAVLGAMMPLAVAAKGYDIPSGADPLVQAHAREMVLPAELSDKIRAMTDTPRSVQITIQAMDGASVARVVSSDAFARAVRDATKDGRL